VPVPLLRCTEEQRGHELFVRSRLAVGAECEGAAPKRWSVGVDDDIPEELKKPVIAEHASSPRADQGPPGRAEARFRPPSGNRAHRRPPARFAVKPTQLGSLRARLAGNVI
jgi:hypothetical protein